MWCFKKYIYYTYETLVNFDILILLTSSGVNTINIILIHCDKVSTEPPFLISVNKYFKACLPKSSGVSKLKRVGFSGSPFSLGTCFSKLHSADNNAPVVDSATRLKP